MARPSPPAALPSALQGGGAGLPPSSLGLSSTWVAEGLLQRLLLPGQRKARESEDWSGRPSHVSSLFFPTLHAWRFTPLCFHLTFEGQEHPRKQFEFKTGIGEQKFHPSRHAGPALRGGRYRQEALAQIFHVAGSRGANRPGCTRPHQATPSQMVPDLAFSLLTGGPGPLQVETNRLKSGTCLFPPRIGWMTLSK